MFIVCSWFLNITFLFYNYICQQKYNVSLLKFENFLIGSLNILKVIGIEANNIIKGTFQL